MGELLDRQFQNLVLRTLADAYPRSVPLARMFGEEGGNRLLVNACYLHEHELLQAQFKEFLDGVVHMGNAKITARGLDFLQDDGGLSAVLGVVTIKIHEDTIKALLIEKVEQSKAEPGIKKRLVDQIRGLPAEAVKVLTVEAVKSGLAHTPDVVAWVAEAMK
ncbi:hypothetical protein FHT80_002802 [Rhizobium sp. BK226]|uniref:hypothetical protein n=1 Tax=Rhizobium sp. BK226 TaxID=2587075 RepID=UPI00161111B4|nr:hypothetical protein [Rhizobium sp. BK226]MBB4113476.1 hypothetical protein [Rhizobium sp. BK226]